MDKRKDNGGPREGTGPKPKPEEDKKVPLTFYIKSKNREKIKDKVSPIIKKLDK